MNQRILIWDIPTRIFHWSLAASFAGAMLTADSERYRDIHIMLGYTLLGLVAFRLVWGFIGSRYARFRSFLFSPRAISHYVATMLKGRPAHYLGHNPAGSIAVFLLLALGLACGTSGVLLFQDIGGDALEELHEGLAFTMLTIVALHVAGVLLSSVLHRENLVGSMISGSKSGPPDAGISHAHAWLGVIMVVAVIAFWMGYPIDKAMNAAATTSRSEQRHHDD